MISAVYSRFSGVLRGGSVWTHTHTRLQRHTPRTRLEPVGAWPHQQEVVVFRFCPQVLEDDLLHEALHQIPVLHDAVTDGPLAGRSIRQHLQRQQTGQGFSTLVAYDGLSMASSPMKKSRSSTPFIIRRCAWSPTLADSLMAIPADGAVSTTR